MPNRTRLKRTRARALLRRWMKLERQTGYDGGREIAERALSDVRTLASDLGVPVGEVEPPPLEPEERPRCAATLNDGRPCPNSARRGGELCGMHAPKN